MNRNAIIAAIVIALAVVGGVYVYQAFFKTHDALVTEMQCGFDDCGDRVTVSLTPGKPWPKCRKCGRMSMISLTSCVSCDNKQMLNEQIIALIPGKETLDPVTKCRKCGAIMRH